MAVGLALGALACTATGCSTTTITSARLNPAIQSTFANLYVLRLAKLGQPAVPAASFAARASCGRDAANRPGSGAGDDWICNIVWRTAGLGTTATAIYDLEVQTDGCYTADGDGPQEINGLRTMVTIDGDTVTNPLWQFNGCIEVT
ncbi:MAG TPA: hypothetical protein VGJ07_18345 [Rugosimonospora sp.]